MTPEELFSGFDPDLEDVCSTLRCIVRKEIPDAAETVQVGWSAVSYRYKTMCVLISPRESCVRLMFDPRGEDLDDPAGLLKETGSRMMHVDFQRVSEITQEHLVPIILDSALISGRKHT